MVLHKMMGLGGGGVQEQLIMVCKHRALREQYVCVLASCGVMVGATLSAVGGDDLSGFKPSLIRCCLVDRVMCVCCMGSSPHCVPILEDPTSCCGIASDLYLLLSVHRQWLCIA